MYLVAQMISQLFPLISLILLIVGVKRDSIYYIVSALWLSFIAIMIHHQLAGGDIFGSYFNYTNALIYSVNLIVLSIAVICILSHLQTEHIIVKYISGFIKSFIIICSFLVVLNLWINAYFIENKLENTPIVQVVLMNKPDYCDYKFIFYTISKDGEASYLCPNYFGLIAKVGHLAKSPEFLSTQLSIPSKKHMLLLQQKKH